jgi:hypothetical protein
VEVQVLSSASPVTNGYGPFPEVKRPFGGLVQDELDLRKIARKGEARMGVAETIRRVYCGPTFGRSNMKLRILRASYALAALVSFVVAAGAGSKFHGSG